MKKLLLIAAALTTMVSCSKTQVIPEETQQQEIAMKAYNQTAVKATGPVSGTSLPEDKETMTIFGFYASNCTDYASTAYLPGVTFGYSGAWKGGSWSGETFNHNPYYWPYSGNMKFIAVYPTAYPNESGAITCVYTSTDESEPPVTTPTTTTISNVNLANINQQKDIMYSSNLYATAVTCPPANVQNLQFTHLLSQVVVAVKPSVANQIKVLGVEWQGAYVKGDILVKESNPLAISYDYDSSTPTANLQYQLLVDDVAPDGGIADISDFIPVSEVGALVLPTKTDGSKPQLSITYSLADGSGNVTKTVNITDVWAQGKKYVYNVTISLNEITFTSSVSDWDTPSNVTTVTPSI